MIAFAGTYFGLLVVIWLRYIVFSAVFWAAIWGRPEENVGGVRLALKRPTAETMWREARTSMAVSFIYALPAAVLIHSWQLGGTAIYSGPMSLLDWVWLPISLLIYLMLHDTYFYWTHRAMHHPKLFLATHRVHHLSKQPTPWAAFYFNPREAVISAPLIPIMAFIVPIHMGTFLFLLTLMTFNAVANHSGWEIWPKTFLDGPIGRHLITARHHNLHHTKFSRNYGLYFRFWDRWMGTDDMSGDPMERV